MLLIDRGLKENSTHKNSVIGNYHSHVFENGKRRKAYLSEYEDNQGDIPFFKNSMRVSGLDESVQIIASVKVLNYKRKHKVNEKIYDYKTGIKVIWEREYTGYDVILSAFKLSTKGRPKKIPLKRG